MQTKTNNQVYAGFFVRLAAYLIDWLIVGTALLIVKVPIFFASLSAPNNILVQDFIFQYSVTDIVIYVLTVTYFILLTYLTGATLGKRLLHLRVVSAEDRRPSFFEILYRETVGKFLSGVCLCIGYLMIGLDKKNRGLHDILADTCVVYQHEKKRYVVPPVVYRDVNAAVPPQNFSSQNFPSQDFPSQDFSPQDFPSQNFSSQDFQEGNTMVSSGDYQEVDTAESSGDYRDFQE